MTISVIVAVSDNGVIGKDGKIPWKLSTDLARFSRITSGTGIVVGRKTFESLPCPLVGRVMFLCSKTKPKYLGDTDYFDGQLQAQICTDVKSACDMALRCNCDEDSDPDDDIFIIGGQQIYDEIFKTPELIHRVYLTRVHCNVEGDTFFNYRFPLPNKHIEVGDSICWINIQEQAWKLISEEFIPKSDKDEYDSTFQVWENRS